MNKGDKKLIFNCMPIHLKWKHHQAVALSL